MQRGAVGHVALLAVTAFSSSKRLADELRQVALAGLVDPALERDLEDGDARLGGQARRRLGDAAPAQRVGERRGRARRA